MQRNVEFSSAFQVVPALKRRLLAEPSASPRLRFLGSRHEKLGSSHDASSAFEKRSNPNPVPLLAHINRVRDRQQTGPSPAIPDFGSLPQSNDE